MANPLGHRYAFISLWLWIKHLLWDCCSTSSVLSYTWLWRQGKESAGIHTYTHKQTEADNGARFARVTGRDVWWVDECLIGQIREMWWWTAQREEADDWLSLFVSPQYLMDFERCHRSCSPSFDMRLLAAISETLQRSTYYSLQVKLVSSAQD